MRRNFLLSALVALAMTQVIVLARRVGGAESGGSWLQAGDDISELYATDASAAPRPLVQGEPTLVLVFHSGCGHCQRIAPEWSAWLRGRTVEGSVIVASSEPFEAAATYARSEDWGAEVRSVDATVRGALAHRLMVRTPWVFFVDTGGTVVAVGHGDELATIGAQWVAAVRSTSGASGS